MHTVGAVQPAGQAVLPAQKLRRTEAMRTFRQSKLKVIVVSKGLKFG